MYNDKGKYFYLIICWLLLLYTINKCIDREALFYYSGFHLTASDRKLCREWMHPRCPENTPFFTLDLNKSVVDIKTRIWKYELVVSRHASFPAYEKLIRTIGLKCWLWTSYKKEVEVNAWSMTMRYN